jgi:hypothetical protein
MNSHVRQKKDMADMIAAMEQEFADAENELRQEFEAQREEIKNRNRWVGGWVMSGDGSAGWDGADVAGGA